MKQWNDYQLILTLAQEKTIRRTAALLGVSHSTISRRLSHINTAFEQGVFEKTQAGYILTGFGRDVLETVKKMQALDFSIQRKGQQIKTDMVGPITLSLPDVIAKTFLIETLGQFCTDYPDIDLTVNCSLSMADLNKMEADIAIRGTSTPGETLFGRRLATIALCEYAHKDYLENTPREERRWIVRPSRTSTQSAIMRSTHPEAPIGIQLDDLLLRHQMVAAGQGMIMGACYLGDSNPNLCRLPGAAVTPLYDLWILTHNDLKNTPRIRRLMRVLGACLSQHRDLFEGRCPQEPTV